VCVCVFEMNAWAVPAKPAIIRLMLPEELSIPALGLDGLIDLELRGQVGPAPALTNTHGILSQTKPLISPMQLQLVRVHFQEGGGRGNEVSANATPIDQPPHPRRSRGKSVHYCITEGGNASIEVSGERAHEDDNGVMQGLSLRERERDRVAGDEKKTEMRDKEKDIEINYVHTATECRCSFMEGLLFSHNG